MRRLDHRLGSRPRALTTLLIVSLINPIVSHGQHDDWTQNQDSSNRIWFADETSGDSQALRQDSLKSQKSYTRLAEPTLAPDFTDRSANMDATGSNFGKCGLANLNWWQEEQRAFKCTYFNRGLLTEQPRIDRSRAQSRIVDGKPATAGQFPFYVKLSIYNKTATIRCGGTLIHDDLVLTVSQCLVNRSRVLATLGTNDAFPTQGGGTQRNATKWCYFNRKGWDNGLDLAIVRLSKPVEYVQNKVEPACMLIGEKWKPKQPTICSVVGMGNTNDKNEAAKQLISLPVRRRCFDYRNVPGDQHAHCYVADDIGTTCAGDIGSPVVCYDKCVNNITRAFAVGAISDLYLKHGCRPGQKLETFRVSEVHEAVYGLVQAVRSSGEEKVLGQYGVCDSPTAL